MCFSVALPALFPNVTAEWSAYMYDMTIPQAGNDMDLERTYKLLYGEMGIVNDPANFEFVSVVSFSKKRKKKKRRKIPPSSHIQLAASIGNDTALATWGLDGGRALPFLRYANYFVDTYSMAFMKQLIVEVRLLLFFFLLLGIFRKLTVSFFFSHFRALAFSGGGLFGRFSGWILTLC